MSFKLSTPKPLNYNPNISKILITTETDDGRTIIFGDRKMLFLRSKKK